ncbi:MAG TPA: POTRA domain-containing protein, partial [Candidatus Caenarcaniphilales bacterium]
MGPKLPWQPSQRLLRLSLGLLLGSMAVRPLKAQAVPLAQGSRFVAQASPAPLIPPPQDLIPPARPAPAIPLPLLPPPAELLPPADSMPSPPDELPNVPGTIIVERFEVVGSTVFSPETFAKVTAAFTQRPLSFAELLQARAAVTQLYIEQGYITSGALIPPQTLQGGVVKIQVVEGGLEAIQVTGTQRLNSNYVRSRLALATPKPLNVPRLLEALKLLQLNPLIKNLSADLSAGARSGTSLLTVQVTEAKSFNTQLVLDNNRSPSVGSFQRGFQLNEANLLGWGDGLSLAYLNTAGSHQVEARYTLPLNPYNGTVSLGYGRTSSDVIEPPFNAFDIQAASHYYELTLRQPIAQTSTQEFAVGLTGS